MHDKKILTRTEEEKTLIAVSREGVLDLLTQLSRNCINIIN